MNNENIPQNNESKLNQINLDQNQPGATLETEDKIINQKGENKDGELPQSTVAIYKDQDETNKQKIKKSSIFGSTFMITNICLGTTIFTFANRAKSFGLVWLLVFCVVVAAINYWSIMRCVYASSKCKEDDFSEITEKLLGKRMRDLLNFIIIIYSYASLMCFIALIFALFGRFIHGAFFKDDYVDYDAFYDGKWGKSYVKYPFYIGLAFILSLICLIKDINKLNFSAYIGVVACLYALLVVTIECNSYYNHYKDTVYQEDNDDTHPNWINLGDAFQKDLIFFKGIANLIFAYACQSGIFPIYAGFKIQENGLKKMRISAVLGMALTTALHFISIICGFLTDPITPEDLIIYRKNKGNGKDIAMIIARLFVSFSLIFTVPGYYFPLRLSVINIFTGGKLGNLFNVLFTFISLFCCSIISAVYDKILNYLNYIGFISVFISFLFPALIYVYSSGEKVTYWKNILHITLAVIMCIIGLVAGIATVIDDVKGN